ncbi:protein of unknown function [Latilactobacillus sakei]|nr:protein of unknown function [Latilactobacillus sakei]
MLVLSTHLIYTNFRPLSTHFIEKKFIYLIDMRFFVCYNTVIGGTL